MVAVRLGIRISMRALVGMVRRAVKPTVAAAVVVAASSRKLVLCPDRQPAVTAVTAKAIPVKGRGVLRASTGQALPVEAVRAAAVAAA
jgi:hypothetical protein